MEYLLDFERARWVVHDEVREVIGPNDIVVGMEPMIDKVIETAFKYIHLTRNLQELLGLIAGSERVVSMQFHGAILGLRAQKFDRALVQPFSKLRCARKFAYASYG